MENQEQAQTVTDQGVAPQQPQQPQLSIVDLQNLRAIIDVATRRGAFQAQELSGVGAVFDRLNSFLNAVAPAQTESTDAPADTTSADTPAA
jgi:hypothetical protein